MDQESSVAKIYWTADYSQFSYLTGNRDIVPSKVNKLMRDIENGLDLFKFCPILVNEKFQIIDGQHRFYVCRKKKLKIYYCIVPDFTMAQIAKVNNNQHRWKVSDFLNCYIDSGKNSEHYKILKQFTEKYHVTISTGVALLYTGAPHANGSVMDYFHEGEFQVRKLDEARELLETALQYADFTDVYNSRNFLFALKQLLANDIYSHSAMIEKLKVHNLRIEKCTNPKAYLAHMEELFNFKNSKRKTIY